MVAVSLLSPAKLTGGLIGGGQGRLSYPTINDHPRLGGNDSLYGISRLIQQPQTEERPLLARCLIGLSGLT
jgi:hypothetical protein